MHHVLHSASDRPARPRAAALGRDTYSPKRSPLPVHSRTWRRRRGDTMTLPISHVAPGLHELSRDPAGGHPLRAVHFGNVYRYSQGTEPSTRLIPFLGIHPGDTPCTSQSPWHPPDCCGITRKGDRPQTRPSRGDGGAVPQSGILCSHRERRAGCTDL